MAAIATDSTSRSSPGDDVMLSIVIPAFNEVDRIGATVARVRAFMRSRPYRSELIVVLDGGRPGAARAIAAAAPDASDLFVMDNEQNRGKGYSVRRGVLTSRGRHVVTVDADLSLPIEDTDRFVHALEAGADLAIGSRALPDSVERGTQQPLRHSLSRLFNWVVQRLVVSGVRDTQSGFKAYRGNCARAIFGMQRTDGFGFDVEVLRIAGRSGYRSVELPVVCEYHATSSVRKFRHGIEMLGDLARIVWHDWRGDYRERH
jgi:dolichyl-phosphate beta-glucosyltransferase